MNMTRRYLFTPRGIDRLKIRIEQARSQYKATCDSNEDAAGAGDSSVWHDNFAYEENQRQMHQQAKKVRDLEVMLAAAEVVTSTTRDKGTVGIGCLVSFLQGDDEMPRQYYMSGYDDGDPKRGRISYNSPLGLKLLGSREGDVLDVRFGGRKVELEILEVRHVPEP